MLHVDLVHHPAPATTSSSCQSPTPSPGCRWVRTQPCKALKFAATMKAVALILSSADAVKIKTERQTKHKHPQGIQGCRWYDDEVVFFHVFSTKPGHRLSKDQQTYQTVSSVFRVGWPPQPPIKPWPAIPMTRCICLGTTSDVMPGELGNSMEFWSLDRLRWTIYTVYHTVIEFCLYILLDLSEVPYFFAYLFVVLFTAIHVRANMPIHMYVYYVSIYM